MTQSKLTIDMNLTVEMWKWKCGNVEMWKCGNVEMEMWKWKCGNGNMEIEMWKCGNVEMCQVGQVKPI